MRDLRLAALDANMNYDSKENSNVKQQRVEGLQEAYEQAVRTLYGTDSSALPEVVDVDDDPLFAPLRRRAEALRAEAIQPLVENAGTGRKLLEGNAV